MDQVLARFVRALRAAGVEASTAETLDAARAVALAGYADRARLREVLAATLAKSAEERDLLEPVFDQFFAVAALEPTGTAPKPAPPEAASPTPTEAPAPTGDADVDALLSLAASATPTTGAGDGSPALRLALLQAAQVVDLDAIRFASQAPYYTRRLMDHLGTGVLEDRLARLLADPSEAAAMEATRLQAARDTLRRAARALVQQRFELFGRAATARFLADAALRRAIGRMSPSDMAELEPLVRRLARRLAQRHARRARLRLQGQIDLRHTLRANAGHDHVPVHLVLRRRRRERPRIVAVCDVSGSVAPHARFLLMFLYALHGVVGDLRSFAFSARLDEVSAPLREQPFEDAMSGILRQIGHGSTDYGCAWQDLLDHHATAIDRRTTVIVLGDARSNGSDPRLDLFSHLAARARRVLWLCPEAPSRWGTGDSCLPQYQPFCRQVRQCASPLDLERILDELLTDAQVHG